MMLLRWTLSWSIAGIWSFIMCFFPVPSGAPRQPSARVVNSSAIVVRWSPPLQKDQAGRLEGYVVYYLKVDDLGNQLYPRPDLQIAHTARGDLVWLLMLFYIVRTVSLHLLRTKLRKSRFFVQKCFSSRASRMTEFSREARDFYKPYKLVRREKNRVSLFTLAPGCLFDHSCFVDRRKNTGCFAV